MTSFRITFAAALALALASPAAAGDGAPALTSPCVVELYTSQGCSSCPKADALLARLAQQEGVIALSMPVDYWDYLGWKDTLAQPAFTARQKSYATARGDAHVYTPQIVVSGVAHAIGSDAADVARAARVAAAAQGAMGVSVRLSETGDKVEIGAKTVGVAQQAQVYALRVERARTVEIGRGENKNKSVTYTNVVRAMARIGAWDGAARSYAIPASVARVGGDAIVVLVQSGDAEKPGVVLGAAMSR